MPLTPPPASALSPSQLEIFRRAALILSSSVDLNEALNNTVAACLPGLGDFGFFDVLLGGTVHRTARAHEDAALEQALSASTWQRNERVDLNLCALSSGDPALHPNTDDDWFAQAFPGQVRGLQFRSMLSVPVFHGPDLIGALTLFMGASGRQHGQDDLQFAAEIASLAAPTVVNARLIEQHRIVEAALRTSEHRFQLALKVGGMGAWQWDIVAGDVYWWPGMAELHGLPADTQLSSVNGYLDLVHPDDRHLAGRSLKGEFPEGTGKGIEYRVVRPDGTVRWIEGRGDVVSDDNGRPIFLSGVCVDVSQRKLTEQRLRFLARVSAELAELVQPEDTLARIAQLAVPDFADWCTVDLLDDLGNLKRVAVAHVDPGKVRFAHELHERYPPDPAAGHGIWQVIRSGKPTFVSKISDEALAASIKDPAYLQIIRDLGLSSYIGVPLTARGKTIGALTFISAESGHLYSELDVDMGEEIGRRAGVAIDNSILYSTLQQNDRRKDEFLAMLAHELRNPLAPISSAADILRQPGADAAKAKKASEVIARQVKHMTSLVDDLLDVSRVTRGLVKLQKESVDFKALITDAVEQTRPLIESRGHVLAVQISDEPMPMLGDRTRLVQVLANLLNNAGKYTPPGGRIQLAALPKGAMIEVSVADNGIGIAAHMLPHIFDLFTQAERTPDRAQGGLGIGLALVKKIVLLHGGTVHASSAGPGCGTTMTVLLPSPTGVDSAP